MWINNIYITPVAHVAHATFGNGTWSCIITKLRQDTMKTKPPLKGNVQNTESKFHPVDFTVHQWIRRHHMKVTSLNFIFYTTCDSIDQPLDPLLSAIFFFEHSWIEVFWGKFFETVISLLWYNTSAQSSQLVCTDWTDVEFNWYRCNGTSTFSVSDQDIYMGQASCIWIQNEEIYIQNIEYIYIYIEEIYRSTSCKSIIHSTHHTVGTI